MQEVGKIPPQAIDLEQVILGALLIDTQCVPVVMSLLTTESFYKDSHQLIYSSCKKLYDNGKTIDLLTVTEELRNAGKIDNVGGAYYITTLTSRIASTVNVEEYCRIVQEKYMKRLIIQNAREAERMAFDDTSDPFECLDVLERSVNSINEVVASGGNMKSTAYILQEVEQEALKRAELYKSGKCTGIRTGLKLLDIITGGWQNGELIILAGRPSMGKSALMNHHALSSGVNACIYSLEMSGVSLMDRMILSLSNIDPNKYRSGAMEPNEWDDFHQAKQTLLKVPIYIDNNPIVSTRYIKSHSKLMKDKGQCDIILVDYLQLADMRSSQQGRSREQEVSQAAREFKIIAKTLNVPVILLSQLSRACEARPDKRPMLSDLRESGAIEQDADIVIFAYRPDYYGLTSANGDSQAGIGYEIIAKGRNIGTGEVKFAHNESMTKIYEYQYPVQQVNEIEPF